MTTTLITHWPNGFIRQQPLLRTLSDCGQMYYEKCFADTPDSNQWHLHEIKAREAFVEMESNRVEVGK